MLTCGATKVINSIYNESQWKTDTVDVIWIPNGLDLQALFITSRLMINNTLPFYM